MTGETTPLPLLRTKLHRPPVVADHLHRQHLLDWLNKRLHRPLTLVSAPAGYGKTTLISCWLESLDIPSAWLSIDKTDNDLHRFLKLQLLGDDTATLM
jgi:LuxR family maltose regulon positive regulatory protein